MKKISVIVPCYNEEKSICDMYDKVKDLFANQLMDYDYELIFADDYSRDNTRVEIEKICTENKKVKAVFNAKNFGYTRSVFNALRLGSGDGTFLIFGDMQDPIELLPEFVRKWESGNKVILGQKTVSEENKFIYTLRTLFYTIMENFSTINQVQHFNGFGFYDRCFIEIMKSIEDPQPYFKGIITEFAIKQSIINYHQSKGNRGKTNVNFARAYDAAMIGLTSYTKILMRISTFIGGILAFFSMLFAGYIFLNKLVHWDTYPIGTASIIVGVFFLSAIQLFFIGILGEYILSINARTMKRPLVVYERKINFDIAINGEQVNSVTCAAESK